MHTVYRGMAVPPGKDSARSAYHAYPVDLQRQWETPSVTATILPIDLFGVRTDRNYVYQRTLLQQLKLRWEGHL